jgi:aminoglycoside phosphotransferase (APT) family kinase protein
MTDHEMIAPGLSRSGLTTLLERHRLGALERVSQIADSPMPSLLVNNTLLIRCAHNPAQRSQLTKEALIYRRLRSLEDVPCPEVVVLDTERDLLPCDVLVLSHLEGVAGNIIWPQLNSVQREHVSEELGRICGAIHSLPWTVYGEVNLDVEPGAQSARWIDIVMQKTARAYEHAQASRLLPQRTLDAFVTAINDSDSVFNTPGLPVLTHADLRLWNVLLRQDGSHWQVAALLGWDSALIADVAWEFAVLWSVPIQIYPLPAAFVHGYKERRIPPPDVRDRQRLYRIVYHVEQALALQAQPNVEPEHVNIHLTAVERLLTPH